MTPSPIQLAIDVGPLYGHRTGVGAAAAGMIRALEDRSEVRLDPYLVSFRSKPERSHRKLPLPGIVASHVWSRYDRPSADRWIDGAHVLHGTNYVAPPSRLPTVISVYDCWFLSHPDAATPLVRRAGETLRRRVADGAWIHTSSEATERQARDLLGTDRVVTVRLGPPSSPPVEVDRPPELRHLAGERFVVAIGTEERRKDLPMLVAAFGRAAIDHPRLRLVLAGAAGDQSAEVEQAIERLAEPARAAIDRLGVVTDDTKHWLVRNATALAYPSLDEGFGFPILEAQAAGTPVVASNVGAVAEIAGPGAILVDDRSADAFADALCGIIDGRTSRLTTIAAGHENLARFSWQATADGLIEIYRRALAAA